MALFDIFIFSGMIGLFIVSLISSIIPIPSEPAVFGLLGAGGNPGLIFIILTSGSILGAFIGYLLGRHGFTKLIRSHENREKQTDTYFLKYGGMFLFVSPWIPFIVDLAPMVAGMRNYDPKKFLIVITVANIFKSTGVVYLSATIIEWWMLFVK